MSDYAQIRPSTDNVARRELISCQCVTGRSWVNRGHSLYQISAGGFVVQADLWACGCSSAPVTVRPPPYRTWDTALAWNPWPYGHDLVVDGGNPGWPARDADARRIQAVSRGLQRCVSFRGVYRARLSWNS